MTGKGRQLAGLLAEWFYPRVCPNSSCGKPSDRPGRSLCWECFRTVELYRESLCERCGAHAEGRVGHAFECGVCREVRPHFDRARSAGRFRGTLREMIHGFKYGKALWLCQDLTDFLAGCLTAHFDPVSVDVVVPVPLHPVRERERSYNQAALLARALAERIGRRYDDRALRRMRHTETQTHLDAVRRRLNMRGAFEVVRPAWVTQRCVLLVDDVMTTGATLDACAHALKRAGARTVWALTVARG